MVSGGCMQRRVHDHDVVRKPATLPMSYHFSTASFRRILDALSLTWLAVIFVYKLDYSAGVRVVNQREFSPFVLPSQKKIGTFFATFRE